MMLLKYSPSESHSGTLPASTRAIIKATVPVLAEKGEAIALCMYRRMFTANPELNAYFNPVDQATGKQPRTLAAALHAYAAYIDDLDVLEPALERIAQKHVSLGVQPAHYQVVGTHLLAALGEILGDAATGEIVGAWTDAYEYLADVLIRREAAIYDMNLRAGGWAGFRPFRVAAKIPECDTITSFILEPADGGSVAPFRAGQYLTLKFDGLGRHGTRRHYSVSSRPGLPYYRVTIKREAPGSDLPHDSVSNHMHDIVSAGDVIDTGAPGGDFALRTDTGRPIALVSAGVGLTPLVSMLHQLADEDTPVPVTFIHGARNRMHHALAGEVKELARKSERIKVHVCYSAPSETCVHGIDHDTAGRMTPELVRTLLPGTDCDVYLVGPTGFMRDMVRGLRALGVPRDQIQLAFFGPAQGLE